MIKTYVEKNSLEPVTHRPRQVIPDFPAYKLREECHGQDDQREHYGEDESHSVEKDIVEAAPRSACVIFALAGGRGWLFFIGGGTTGRGVGGSSVLFAALEEWG